MCALSLIVHLFLMAKSMVFLRATLKVTMLRPVFTQMDEPKCHTLSVLDLASCSEVQAFRRYFTAGTFLVDFVAQGWSWSAICCGIGLKLSVWTCP